MKSQKSEIISGDPDPCQPKRGGAKEDRVNQQMQSKEQKFKLREDELKTQKRKVRICLNEMADWTVNHLNFEALASSNEKSTHLEFELPDKKNKLEASCSALRNQLVKARQQLAAKT